MDWSRFLVGKLGGGKPQIGQKYLRNRMGADLRAHTGKGASHRDTCFAARVGKETGRRVRIG